MTVTGDMMRGIAEAGREIGLWNTIQEVSELSHLRGHKWFLVKNDGPQGEAWKCRECGQLHPYFTDACIERPFNGLNEIVGWLENLKFFDLDSGQQINADEAERLRKVGQAVGVNREIAGMILGSIEPIPEWRALMFKEKIEFRRRSPLNYRGEESPQEIQTRLHNASTQLRLCRCAHARLSHNREGCFAVVETKGGALECTCKGFHE